MQPVQPQQQVALVPRPPSEELSIDIYTTQPADLATQAWAERHTRALGAKMAGYDKQYRIEAKIRKENDEIVTLPKATTQADQGSDINVISPELVSMLQLKPQALGDIGFAGLSMRTADHRETILHLWVTLTIGVANVWRTIRYFVGPKTGASANEGHKMSLILGLPWLWQVNAHLAVRDSKLFLGDPKLGEEVRVVVGPEIFFSTDHTMLMYPKALDSKQHPPKATVEEINKSSDEDLSVEVNSSSSDDLSEI